MHVCAGERVYGRVLGRHLYARELLRAPNVRQELCVPCVYGIVTVGRPTGYVRACVWVSSRNPPPPT